MKRRRNPAPSAEWTEIVETKRMTRGDRMRGGPRTIVWQLAWVEAGRDAQIGDRATAYLIERRLGGLVFNERALYTHFSRAQIVFDEDIGWDTRAASEWRVRPDETPPWLDDDALRTVGLHGYQVLQMMLERVEELEANQAKLHRRVRKSGYA